MVANSLSQFVVVDFEHHGVGATLLGFPDAEVRSSSVTAPVALRRGDEWCVKKRLEVGLNSKTYHYIQYCTYHVLVWEGKLALANAFW